MTAKKNWTAAITFSKKKHALDCLAACALLSVGDPIHVDPTPLITALRLAKKFWWGSDVRLLANSLERKKS